MISIRKEIRLGEILPPFYGAAYLLYYCDKVVAYPVPINIIVRFFRFIWYELIKLRPLEIDNIKYESYHTGYAEGYKKGIAQK